MERKTLSNKPAQEILLQKNDNDGPKLNPLALTSMILGILSLLAVISYFKTAMGIVAIILGIVANKSRPVQRIIHHQVQKCPKLESFAELLD